MWKFKSDSMIVDIATRRILLYDWDGDPEWLSLDEYEERLHKMEEVDLGI